MNRTKQKVYNRIKNVIKWKYKRCQSVVATKLDRFLKLAGIEKNIQLNNILFS